MSARKITLVNGVSATEEQEERAIDEVYAEMRDGYRELLDTHVRESGWDTTLLWMAYDALASGDSEKLRNLGIFAFTIAEVVDEDDEEQE